MHHVPLRDGRKLAYCFFGAGSSAGSGSGVAGSAGAPPRTVLYLHGFPSSRLEAGLLHQDALHYGLRVVGIDRPGAGGSTLNPQLTVESTAADVQELLDHLGLPSVVIMGASGAVACRSGVLFCFGC
jgi:pimeloyl-ACP methyl ester carboxylesterase